MSKKYGFVYIWLDRKHMRYYVGCHWGTEDDGYVCSSPWMRQAYKIRPEDFRRRILKTNIDSREQTYIEEQKWLNLIKENEIGPNSSNPRYYNLNIKNNEIWSKYEESVKTVSEKISIRTKEAMQDPEIRQRYLDGLAKRDNRSSDPSVREKRSIGMKGKNAGRVTVRYAAGGKAFHVTKDDPRLLSGEVVHVTKGLKRGPQSEERREHARKTSHFYKINTKRIKCDHCDFVGLSPHIARYHNSKCKQNPELICA